MELHADPTNRSGKADAFYQEDVVQMLLNGLYYGLMLVMALYNAFVYFSIRERSYLVYVWFRAFCGDDAAGFVWTQLSVSLAVVAVVGWGELSSLF